MALTVSTDYTMWEGLEAVTFKSRTGSSSVQDFTVASAKRRAPTYRELAASNGAYTGQDLVWLLPAALMPSRTGPNAARPGDKVTDADGVTWTALEVSLNKLKQTWRLVTRNLVLAYALQDQIDIQRPAITYDAAGGAVRTWPDDSPSGGTVAYRNLPAKVQLISQDMQDVLGVRGFVGTYAVTVGEQVTLTKEDRIKWGSVYLEIKGQHNPQRIDELPVLDCELLP